GDDGEQEQLGEADETRHWWDLSIGSEAGARARPGREVQPLRRADEAGLLDDREHLPLGQRRRERGRRRVRLAAADDVEDPGEVLGLDRQDGGRGGEHGRRLDVDGLPLVGADTGALERDGGLLELLLARSGAVEVEARLGDGLAAELRDRALERLDVRLLVL